MHWCIEFVDELAIAAGSIAPSLLPGTAFARAAARVAAARVNKEVCSSYYQVGSERLRASFSVGSMVSRFLSNCRPVAHWQSFNWEDEGH